MKRNRLLVLGLLLAIVLVAQAGCISVGRSAGEGLDILRGLSATGINVSGEGKVSVTPDLAILNLGIESRSKTVDEAQRRAATAMDAVMSALTGQGVDKKDIKTQYFNIRQDRRFVDRVEVIDYVVSNTVTAKIRKVADAGKIIDAVAAAGGDLTRIRGVSFTVDDPTPFLNQAREKAMADAKAKAEQIARLAGVKLGNPVSISEGGGFVPRPEVFMAEGRALGAAPAPETPISPGETEIRLNVQVRYAIE